MVDKMKKLEALIPIFVIAIFASLYIYKISSTDTHHISKNRTKKTLDKTVEINSSNLYSAENIKNYIVSVINNGSNHLHYPGGEMEGGYISPKDADMVACYVLELSGRKCPYPYPKKAEMYFSSVCAGCHGNDGKGLNGSYPDLTVKKLKGLEMLEKGL